MKPYLLLIKKINPDINTDKLDTPINDSGFDSLGLIELRVEFEKYVGFKFSDEQWSKFNTISEIIDYCSRNKASARLEKNHINKPSIEKTYDINMSQMNNQALSENWLFKTLGDMHWQILFENLNTKSSLLSDENNNRLYATFIRIKIILSPLNNFKENQTLNMKGELSRYGKSTYLSEFTSQALSNNIESTLITTFSKRQGKDNLDLVKSTPDSNVDRIPETDEINKYLGEYRFIKDDHTQNHNFHEQDFVFDGENKFETLYTINPFYDINGVGLLYFASYPVISDYCESQYFNDLNNINQWENEYYTCAREIFYFANCNINDKIIYKLNSFEFYSNNVKINSSLYREKDNKLMAKIFTIKEKIN